MKSERIIRLLRNYLIIMATEADSMATEQSLLDCAETLTWVLTDTGSPERIEGLEGELYELLEDYARQIATEHN